MSIVLIKYLINFNSEGREKERDKGTKMSKEVHSLTILSVRDQQQFKNIVQLYDQRIYKRALKLTETMLKKYPKQGDLLSMKAFILSAMHPESKDEKHKEAYECAKEAIKQNMKSPMSWHCLGTLYKGDFDYSEAIKCFKTALKFDKDDLVVLRDLATCYVQTRNYVGFRDIRNEMKRIRPEIRTNWIASALGNHFCGYINSAINCLVSIDKFGVSNGRTLSKRNAVDDEEDYGVLFSFLEPFQRSELLLYFVRLLLDGRKYQQAYNFLRSNQNFILEKTDYYTILGNLLLKCNKNYTKECRECFERLLAMYPDDDFALFGCMITDKSLRNVVLAPPNVSDKLVKELSLKDEEIDESSSFESDEVIPICGIGSGIFHTRGTSGIMYYPLLVNESVGRNKYLNDKKLSSKEYSLASYGYKLSSSVYNQVLEFIVYDDDELKGNKTKYENSMKRIGKFFEEKKSQFPASDTILRLELAFLKGKEFLVKFRAYVLGRLGSRITGLKSLIGYLIKMDARKKDLIHMELTSIVKELEGLYEKGELSKNELATLYYIYSQHLDCMGLPLEGLDYIEKSLKLDDSRPDGFNIKRKLLKHLYRFEEAQDAIDHARLMEKNDKYLNTRTICACLENGQFEKAKELLKVFMTYISDISKSKRRESTNSSSETEIKNLQIIWYEKRAARYRELLDLSSDGYLMAFDHYLRLMESMEIMKTDQYDYHLYCLRKMTLYRYLDFINMHDKLFCNTDYRKISVMFWRRLWLNILKIKYGKLELPLIQKKNSQSKSEEEVESLKDTTEFVKDSEGCWKMAHKIIQNHRKDCIFHVQSYIPIYIQYYCSQRLLANLSLETCILVCSQSIYRTYILEKSCINENQIGIFPVLLVHFYTNMLNRIKSGMDEVSKDYRAGITMRVVKQLQIFTDTKDLTIDGIEARFRDYISNINIENVTDIESLCNLVKISIINGSFNNIEAYLDDFNKDLNKFSGIFNQQIVNLAKLLLIRSLRSDKLDTEPLSQTDSELLIEKIASSSKSNLLDKVLNSYNIYNRSFLSNQDNNHKSILQVQSLKDQMSREIIDICNLPILALSI